MKIRYNAPTVLTFAFISALILLLSQTISWAITRDWFVLPGRGDFTIRDVRNWFRLVSHVLGHSSWTHLVSNFSIILLIGPILEEIYGSISLLLMFIVTAFVTGVLHAVLFSSDLLGASGIVFMMILLVSFTNFNRGEVPLTFILVLLLYLGREFYIAFENMGSGSYNISHFAHIVGGLIGSLFGFLSHGARIRR